MADSKFIVEETKVFIVEASGMADAIAKIGSVDTVMHQITITEDKGGELK